MYTQYRKQSGGRRLPTPLWALRSDMLRDLIVFFLQSRALVGPTKVTERLVGPPAARLRRAQAILAARRERQAAILEGFRAKLAANPGDKKLAIEADGMETYLRYTAQDGGLATIAAIIFFYYRTGLDSVGTGIELGLKSFHIRMILWRLHRDAAKLAAAGDERFLENERQLQEWRAGRNDKFERKARARRSSIPSSLRVGDAVVYRNRPATLVAALGGGLCKIKNAAGEMLTVELGALEK